MLTAALGGLMMLGCATPTANLQISAPSSVTADTPFAITVTAMDSGNRDTVFNSYIRFSSSDPAAVLPSHYQFTAADAGSHTFPGLRLMTVGTQTITATMIYATSINGSANVAVVSSPPTTR